MDTKEPATPAAASAKAERVAEGAEPPPIGALGLLLSVVGRLWTRGAPRSMGMGRTEKWASGFGRLIPSLVSVRPDFDGAADARRDGPNHPKSVTNHDFVQGTGARSVDAHGVYK